MLLFLIWCLQFVADNIFPNNRCGISSIVFPGSTMHLNSFHPAVPYLELNRISCFGFLVMKKECSPNSSSSILISLYKCWIQSVLLEINFAMFQMGSESFIMLGLLLICAGRTNVPESRLVPVEFQPGVFHLFAWDHERTSHSLLYNSSFPNLIIQRNIL